MQIKTFQAPSMHEVLEQVRRDLGPDAILLGNRKVPGPDGSSWVEISAALERPGKPPASPEAAPVQHPGLPEVQDQLEDIRGMLSLLFSSRDAFARLQLNPTALDFFQQMLLRGLDEKNAFQIFRSLFQETDTSPASKRQVFDAFRSHISDKIRFQDPFEALEPNGEGPALFTFVGPTGVGKTTTLAKLAAYLKYKRRLKVGLISLDTYRIGALDQLRTYADILEMPLEVAQCRESLEKACRGMGECRVLLVDTIGRNYLEARYVEDLQAVFPKDCGAHHLLVLSATSKDEDIKNVIRRFRSLSVESLIFTKIDETLTPGSIVNPLLRYGYPLSFLGIGQRVPEDLVRATPQRIMSFFFPRGR
ncbi:flagellar biosynthesis protein FlhF [Desulfacinum hydrothermale DSM 13146]|uniref:Flagellar biosynthesis protein FlhF n=1 Tax=Desulfacinum hydrothermale DSM 13146 TaxID=1121390 RepID=A0A1W1X686_9BACT|nr:hypothetical protein [Desulfacinum hydrothermale]SMC19360.1 flagellar biosynthesis protein FlhF [Desulfacinum hydrothermale DSM 13146]